MKRHPSQNRTTRRVFLGQTLSSCAMSELATTATRSAAVPATVLQQSGASLRVEGSRITAESSTLAVTLENGFITALRSKATGEEYLRDFDTKSSAALQLIYRSDETVGLDPSRSGRISVRQVAPLRAETIFESWDGDGVLSISIDQESGDLVIEPAAQSSRPGVRACRWNLRGLRADLQLVAPFFQGVCMKLDDTLLKESRWPWPVSWEAAFAILQSPTGGCWIHTQDSRYRYKSLKVGSKDDAFALGFDTEAYGPIDDNMAAGSLAWRINVFQGDWRVPAERYRTWLRRAYGLDAAERKRREWVHGVRLALCWCPGDTGILDALERRIAPGKVLIHFPDWRTDRYDENYPTYTASDRGRAFVAECRKRGFHVMPHFNSIDMDPSHPVYATVRDFQYRDLERKNLLGWSWVDGRSIGVPESNVARLENRDKKVMIKVHPGLSRWRSILCENIRTAVRDLSLDTVFIDVTLNTFNIHNCIVEAVTPTEGMSKLIDQVAAVGDGLVVGGEGLNEITAQGQSFAQAHLFRSWQSNSPGLERTGGCALNEFLFGRLCRTIGYSGLSGRNAAEELRMRIHQEHGAIPTLTVRSGREIEDPNPALKRLLDAIR